MDVILELPKETGSFMAGLERSLLRHMRSEVEGWAEVCFALDNWEKRNLYPIEKRSNENLKTHDYLLSELEKVGGWLRKVTDAPDYPEKDLKATVVHCLWLINEKRQMYHNSMPDKEAADILAEAFSR